MKAIRDKVEQDGMDLLDFAGFEHRNYLVTLANQPKEINLVKNIQELFRQAMQMKDFDHDEIAIPQLLVFLHYNFLHSISSFLRGHVGGSFSALRSGIDASLIAAFIIKDRHHQVAYFDRTKPFDKLIRHINSLPEKGAEIHHLIPRLKLVYDMCSEQSHADPRSFAHRLQLAEKDNKQFLNVDYFQLIQNEYELKAVLLTLCRSFLSALEVFSSYLINEKKMVGGEWLEEIQDMGSFVEFHIKEHQAKINIAA